MTEQRGEVAPAPPSVRVPPRSRVSLRNPFIEILLVVMVALGATWAVQAYVVKPYRIPSLSMLPTLASGDRILALRLVYDFRDPHRGEVVVFHPPGRGDQPIRDARGEAHVTFVKRIIGLPGETVKIRYGKVVICAAPGKDCRQLGEPYLSGPPDLRSFGPYTVPSGEYFVLGDNRTDSDDSRIWGFLPRGNIVGKAVAIYWPLDRAGSL
jgi:signal peptidase I